MEDNGKQKFKLDETSEWLEFEIGGVVFEVEAFEAVDLLSLIDYRHQNDPNDCLKCGSQFVNSIEETGGEADKIVCTNCGARGDDVRPAQLFLDDVKDLIVDRWGAKRCSRNEAAQFYNIVVAKTNEAKKKNSQLAE